MRSTHALLVHRLHRFVHAFHDARHVPRHLAHRHGRLDPAREAEEVQRLVPLADRVRCIYPSSVIVALLKCLYKTSSVCRVSSFSNDMWGRGGREGRSREEGRGDGIHVPSLVVIFMISHLFGPFFLAGSATLP